MAQALGKLDAPLQRLHAAKAAADHRRPLADAEIIRQPRLRAHPVGHRNQREIGAVGFAGFGIGRSGTAAAVAAAQIVEGDDEKAVGVDGLARTDHIVPPARVFVVGVVAAGNVVVAGERVADQYRIAFVGIQAAVGFHHQIEARQRAAVLQGKRLVKGNQLRADDGGAGNGHGKGGQNGWGGFQAAAVGTGAVGQPESGKGRDFSTLQRFRLLWVRSCRCRWLFR